MLVFYYRIKHLFTFKSLHTGKISKLFKSSIIFQINTLELKE